MIMINVKNEIQNIKVVLIMFARPVKIENNSLIIVILVSFVRLS